MTILVKLIIFNDIAPEIYFSSSFRAKLLDFPLFLV